MATYTATIISAAPSVTLSLIVSESSAEVSNNRSKVSWTLQYTVSGGTRTGGWDYNVYINGAQVANSNISVSGVTGTHTITSGTTGYITHNVNGSKSVACSAYMDAYYGTGTASGTLVLTDFPEPASGSFASSSIKSTSAVLSATVTTNGNGTSSTQTFYYRVSGVGSYVSAGTGSPKTLTGLKPNTNYQWYVVTTNNTGNSSTGSTQTFKTKGVAGHTPLLMKLLRG